MKKRIFILPILILSVILSCFSFTAYAEDETLPYTPYTEWDNEPYYLSPSRTYIQYMHQGSMAINFADSSFDTDYIYSDGVYTFNTLLGENAAFHQRYYPDPHSLEDSTYYSSSNWSSLIVDINNSTISGISYGGSNVYDVPIQYITIVINGEVVVWYGEPVEESNGIVKKCAVREHPKSEIGRYQAA